MKLSNRFLNLVKQQLSSFEAEAPLEKLVVYIAQARDGRAPSLEAVSQWPATGNKSLPPVEADPELRAPSPDRRWYPLQEGTILLGVLRAEKPLSSPSWPTRLDRRLLATASAITDCLSLELERARLLDELAEQREQISLMVHQLRNPLAALRTYAQLLMKRLEPDSRHRTLIKGLLSEQAQLDRYISSLDQIGQDNLPIEPSIKAPLLLPPLLPQATDLTIKSLLTPLIERAIATSALQKRPWHGPSQWPAWTEELRPSADGVVAEIVANLLENAFRYSPAGRPIGLCLQQNGVCVWDGGEPINKQERERIFSRGIRGQSSGDRPGSGLGLALGRQLAEDLGGSLQLITSPANLDPALPSEGNAFLLSLPAVTPPATEA